MSVLLTSTTETRADGLTLGGVEVTPHPHFDVAAVYNDNITIAETHPPSDLSFVVQPGLLLQVGEPPAGQTSGTNHPVSDRLWPFVGGGFVPVAIRDWVSRGRSYFLLDYTAAIERFARLDQFDTVNHEALLDTHLKFNQFSLDAVDRFQDVTAPNIIAGARVHEESNTADLNGEYRLSTKTSVGLECHQQFHHYLTAGQIDNEEYQLAGTFYYHLSKLDLFSQYNHGWVNVAQGADIDYDEGNVGVRGRLTSKITALAKVGYQNRESAGSTGGTAGMVTSVRVRAEFDPRTLASVELSRAIHPSITDLNESYWGTRVGLLLSHTLPNEKFTFGIGAAYEKDDYDVGVVRSVRQDDHWMTTVGVSERLNKWLAVGCRYQYQQNHSSQPGRSSVQNIVSLQATADF